MIAKIVWQFIDSFELFNYSCSYFFYVIEWETFSNIKYLDIAQWH